MPGEHMPGDQVDWPAPDTRWAACFLCTYFPRSGSRGTWVALAITMLLSYSVLSPPLS